MREIKYGEWTLKASFMKIHAPEEKFFVVFRNNDQDIASFDIVKHNGHWIVIHPAPDWVICLQQQLADIINKACLN
jgi:hypothetical protein